MPIIYDFTVTTDGHSTCAPGSVSVSPGVSQTFTFSADVGYHVEDVTIDGVSHGSIQTYTFTNVQAGHTVDVTSAVGSPTITATAGSGGSITPSGATAVTTGADQTFTVTASPGYCVRVVTVDGVSIGIAAAHTFTNVQADHTISVTFTRDFVNAICDALVQHLQAEMTTGNGYAVDFSAAGAKVERNPSLLDWGNVPRPYIAVSYDGTANNAVTASGGVYRAEADFLVRFFVNYTSGVDVTKAIGERMAAQVMQEIMHAVAQDTDLLGVLASGWIYPKESAAGVDPNAGSLICGGVITFGATWEWTA